MYPRQTETAIAVASRLAEVFDGGTTRRSVTEIAESRDLQRPFVAKILTVRSQAGRVGGVPGPGGVQRSFDMDSSVRVGVWVGFVSLGAEDYLK